MKVSKKQLEEMVRRAVISQLNEEDNKGVDGMPEDVVSYSKKVEDLIKNTIEEAHKLHEEGEKMMRSNVLSSYEVQERNRFLLYYVGFLSNLAANLVARLEDSHRQH